MPNLKVIIFLHGSLIRSGREDIGLNPRAEKPENINVITMAKLGGKCKISKKYFDHITGIYTNRAMGGEGSSLFQNDDTSKELTDSGNRFLFRQDNNKIKEDRRYVPKNHVDENEVNNIYLSVVGEGGYYLGIKEMLDGNDYTSEILPLLRREVIQNKETILLSQLMQLYHNHVILGENNIDRVTLIVTACRGFEKNTSQANMLLARTLSGQSNNPPPKKKSAAEAEVEAEERPQKKRPGIDYSKWNQLTDYNSNSNSSGGSYNKTKKMRKKQKKKKKSKIVKKMKK